MNNHEFISSFLFCTQGGIFVWITLPENIDADGKLLVFTCYKLVNYR